MMTVAGEGSRSDNWRAQLDELVGKVDRLGPSNAAPEKLLAALPGVFGDNVGAGVASAIQTGCMLASLVVSGSAGVGRAGRKKGGEEKEEEQEEQEGGTRARINYVLSSLYYINQALGASTVACRVLQRGSAAGGDQSACDEELVAGIARFSPPDPEETNKMQQLLMYLLNTAQAKGYRRRHGDMYRRITVRGTLHDTHAWERVCKMREFVYEVTRKEVSFEMWLNLTCMRTNVHAATEHLAACHDVQLPELHKDRHVFSFSNGIYLAASDRFVRYGTPEHAALPSELVAARFFDAEFPEELARDTGADDWYDIPTPHIQSILDYQDMGRDVAQWMYVMIGRLIYDVNELDGWQVLPFLKGAASSGKSTIVMRVCRTLYEPADVGTLSNNIERKFGLSALHDKLIFVGPEIKSDIALEQADFQSIVSGETVQVAVKYQTAQTVDWKVPGVLAGNEVPGWVDNSGSINRRIVLFDFPRRVHDGDMELGRRVEAEVPVATLLKCNRAYLDAVRKYARDNLWKHLPSPFHAAKEEFTESVNSIVHFLRSGQLQFGAGMYMPFENFAAMYESYVASMGLTRMRLSGDKVSSPLLEACCKVVKNQTMRYPRAGSRVVCGRFIVGMDVADAGDGASPDPLGD